MTDVLRYLTRLLEDSGIVELRHQIGDRWESGLFDEMSALRLAIRERCRRGNLYTTMNRPHPRPAPNAFGCPALTDADIAEYRHLPFDFDPVRPIGVPSTDAELAAAIAARDRFVRAMLARDWPLPLSGMSGNGAHAVYRVKFPADADARQMLAVLYAGLRLEHSSASVLFDSTVRNPSRIWRLYGSRNRKGIATTERPHRKTSCTIPPIWQVVPVEQVLRLAESFAPQVVAERKGRDPVMRGDFKPGAGDYSTLDAVAWFAAHDHYRRPLWDGKHAVTCPWVGEHTTPDDPLNTSSVIFENVGTGWPGFFCAHAHCDGRTITHVMELWGDADRYCARQWRAS